MKRDTTPERVFLCILLFIIGFGSLATYVDMKYQDKCNALGGLLINGQCIEAKIIPMGD